MFRVLGGLGFRVLGLWGLGFLGFGIRLSWVRVQGSRIIVQCVFILLFHRAWNLLLGGVASRM